MSDTTSAKPRSVILRDAHRAAIRQHPDFNPLRDGDPSKMTQAELREKLTELGADPAAIGNAAIAAAGLIAGAARTVAPVTSTAPIAPAPVSDEDADAAVLAEVSSLRGEILDRGFKSVEPRLAELIRAAQKPPVVIEVEKPAPLPAGVHNIKPRATSTWGVVFGVTGPAAAQPVTIWDHPQAPKPNPVYVFPATETGIVLGQIARSEANRAKGAGAKHVLAFGAPGTGKTTMARELAARTGRPFVCLALNDGIEMDQLIGQTVLDKEGGTKWQDGVLLAAIRQPGMVICLDEVGGMRPSVGVALNSLLQDMVFYVPDTGERVPVARNVIIFATNNANLSESGAAKGFVGITRQNRAFADRFGVSVEIGYPAPIVEASLLVSYTGCTPSLADLLVGVATLSRAKAASEELAHGLGFRRLLAWAETLTDGVEPEAAFRASVLNTAPAVDVEVLRQIALVATDAEAIARALSNDTIPAPSAAGAAFPVDMFAAGSR